MRGSLVLIALTAAAAAGPALALQVSDTMAAWQGASADAKAALVSDLMRRSGYGGSRASVISCLDAAAGAAGHADLPIVEVAKACQANSGDPA